jgi:CheY-like chemotaxis protein
LARTVLLADDSVTAQNMGRRILMDAGYEVITVNNGSAALKKIHESKPDLIVLDVYMPGYGGLEVCQRLKESSETMKIPVLLTVGKMEPFKADEARRVRADAHIVKPFDASELLAALTRLEDRIVPADGRGTGKSKKARIWHSQDPAKNFDDSKTDQIAYLAEVKQRHVQGEPVEEIAAPQAGEQTSVVAEASTTAELRADSAANAPAAPEQESRESEEAAATLASAPEPVEVPSIAATSAPEFLVEKESPVEFQTEPAVEPALEPTGADPASASVPEAAPPVENKSRWVAEKVALSAEEASIELEREMQTAQVESSSLEASVADQRLAEPESGATVSSPDPEAGGETFASASEPATSAFAAAASAGTPVIAESTVNPECAPEPPVPSEAAAAWENWQQIRNSVMAPQDTAALAESVAEVAHASAISPSEEPGQSLLSIGVPPVSEGPSGSVDLAETPTHSSATAESLEGEALSSIVDSVLAELKPKLMEQIAKKLKAEKK